MNVKVSSITKKSIAVIKKIQLAKLNKLKSEGKTKKQLYKSFPKLFVNKNY